MQAFLNHVCQLQYLRKTFTGQFSSQLQLVVLLFLFVLLRVSTYYEDDYVFMCVIFCLKSVIMSQQNI